MLPGGGSGGTNIRGPPRRSIATGAVPSGIFPYEREPTSEFLQLSRKKIPRGVCEARPCRTAQLSDAKGGTSRWCHRVDCRPPIVCSSVSRPSPRRLQRMSPRNRGEQSGSSGPVHDGSATSYSRPQPEIAPLGLASRLRRRGETLAKHRAIPRGLPYADAVLGQFAPWSNFRTLYYHFADLHHGLNIRVIGDVAPDLLLVLARSCPISFDRSTDEFAFGYVNRVYAWGAP